MVNPNKGDVPQASELPRPPEVLERPDGLQGVTAVAVEASELPRPPETQQRPNNFHGTAAAAEHTSAAGVPAGYIGAQVAAEEKKVGTQIAAVVASDKVPRGDKPVMIARSRPPAESSHLLNVEYDPTVKKQTQDRCKSLLGEPVWSWPGQLSMW